MDFAARLRPHLSRDRVKAVFQELVRVPSPQTDLLEAEPQQDIRRDVARTVVERGWGLLELRPTRMSLEEIFLQLTTEEQPEEADRG